jgi:hypothetical protein
LPAPVSAHSRSSVSRARDCPATQQLQEHGGCRVICGLGVPRIQDAPHRITRTDVLRCVQMRSSPCSARSSSSRVSVTREKRASSDSVTLKRRSNRSTAFRNGRAVLLWAPGSCFLFTGAKETLKIDGRWHARKACAERNCIARRFEAEFIVTHQRTPAF